MSTYKTKNTEAHLKILHELEKKAAVRDIIPNGPNLYFKTSGNVKSFGLSWVIRVYGRRL